MKRTKDEGTLKWNNASENNPFFLQWRFCREIIASIEWGTESTAMQRRFSTSSAGGGSDRMSRHDKSQKRLPKPWRWPGAYWLAWTWSTQLNYMAGWRASCIWAPSYLFTTETGKFDSTGPKRHRPELIFQYLFLALRTWAPNIRKVESKHSSPMA